MTVVDRPPTYSGPYVTDEAELPDVPRRLSQVTSDDFLACIGSLVGSFALVWVVYFDILPLSGVVGFVVCWYFGFMAMFGGVTALSHPRVVVINRLMGAVVVAAALLVLFALGSVVVYVVFKAHSVLPHLNFFTKSEFADHASLTGTYSKGGITNCIVGSLIQVGIAAAMALPLGLGTAVYMTEFGGRFAKIVRTVVEAMTAVPDLLAGLFVYAFLILELHRPTNGLAVSIALAVTMTPIVARSAEVALKVVPGGLSEASLALGASQWQTVRRVVLPTARPGLAGALILALARGIGEAAPLLIVSGASGIFNDNPLDKFPMNSLPLYIYEGVRSGQPKEIARGFAAATVLLFMVLILFILTRLLARQRVGNR